jgi:hypothetical protein
MERLVFFILLPPWARFNNSIGKIGISTQVVYAYMPII